MNAPKTIKRRSIHSARLERWLGKEKIEKLANDMRNGGGPGNRWYWKPINLRDVPGSVWITADGDFVGDFERGYFDTALDSLSRHLRDLWKAAGKPIYQPEPVFGAGFASISDALSRASQGYGQPLNGAINKAGPTGVQGVSSTLWRVGNTPAGGSAGAAAPGGTAHTEANTGALQYENPASGTLHLVGADMSAQIANNSLMLYDRLFSVAKTMNSTTTEAVTGVPTRYQSTTATAADYIGGNFLFIEVGGTALAATAHNWTVCTYTDQANAASTLPSVTGNASAIVDRFDMPTQSWFCPLESGDVGIKALTQMQCSALVATGAINFVIGHPIGIMAFPIANTMTPFDWLTNRLQAPRIFDNACLAFIELVKPSTNASTYTGQVYATSAAP
jgi:hypothetical protein